MNESAGADSNPGLTNMISESERYLLPLLLGQDQYDTLQAELAKTPFTEGAGEAADQVYVDLVNGSGSWQGIRPLLSNYIFCRVLEETEVKVTMVGSGKGKTQGFTIADNSAKFVRRWNIFVGETLDLKEYLEDSGTLDLPEDYPEFETLNSLGL